MHTNSIIVPNGIAGVENYSECRLLKRRPITSKVISCHRVRTFAVRRQACQFRLGLIQHSCTQRDVPIELASNVFAPDGFELAFPPKVSFDRLPKRSTCGAPLKGGYWPSITTDSPAGESAGGRCLPADLCTGSDNEPHSALVIICADLYRKSYRFQNYHIRSIRRRLLCFLKTDRRRGLAFHNFSGFLNCNTRYTLHETHAFRSPSALTSLAFVMM